VASNRLSGLTDACSAGAASLIKVPKIQSLGAEDPSKWRPTSCFSSSMVSDSDTGTTVQLVIWGVAESAITIIAASIPILRALLRDGKPSMIDVSSFSDIDGGFRLEQQQPPRSSGNSS